MNLLDKPSWRVSQALEDLRDRQGELHVDAGLAGRLINVIKTDEAMLREALRVVDELRVHIERMSSELTRQR